MQFLGTGAAETLPNPFCDCPVCTNIRQDGFAYFKKRSCFQLNESIMIDFGPDVIAAAHQYGIDFCTLRHILFTHSHDDHLSLTNLSLLGMSSHHFPEPLQLYFSPEAYVWVYEQLQTYNPDFIVIEDSKTSSYLRFSNNNLYHLQAVLCNTSFQIDNHHILPVRSTHPAWGKNEFAWNYAIVLPDGRRLLYACDTGCMAKETFAVLQGQPIDILILECTFGSRRMPSGCGHLDAYSFLKTVDELDQHNLLSSDVQVYSTHLNHKHNFTPLMLQQFFDQNSSHHITVARDGDIIL